MINHSNVMPLLLLHLKDKNLSTIINAKILKILFLNNNVKYSYRLQLIFLPLNLLLKLETKKLVILERILNSILTILNNNLWTPMKPTNLKLFKSSPTMNPKIILSHLLTHPTLLLTRSSFT